MTREVYTIGYEGADVDRFLTTLKDAGVAAVADVRAVALSRKKGFSKSQLRGNLAEVALGYRHFIDLGTPKAGREAARAGIQRLPRDASPVRVRQRDGIDGRPRGNLSKFGISRVRFRDMAHRGELPGITKSSW